MSSFLYTNLPDHAIFFKRFTTITTHFFTGIREFARRAGASVVVFCDDDIPRLLCAKKSVGAVNLFCFPAMSNFHGYKWDLSLVARLQENPDNLVLLDAGKGQNSETKLYRQKTQILFLSLFLIRLFSRDCEYKHFCFNPNTFSEI
jgi:hypothetical protein